MRFAAFRAVGAIDRVDRSYRIRSPARLPYLPRPLHAVTVSGNSSLIGVSPGSCRYHQGCRRCCGGLIGRRRLQASLSVLNSAVTVGVSAWRLRLSVGVGDLSHRRHHHSTFRPCRSGLPTVAPLASLAVAVGSCRDSRRCSGSRRWRFRSLSPSRCRTVSSVLVSDVGVASAGCLARHFKHGIIEIDVIVGARSPPL